MPFISSRGRTGFGRTKAAPAPTPGAYTITAGTKAPVGSAGMTSVTMPLSGQSADDGFTTTTIANSFRFYGTGYTTIYPGTNTYLTFTAGSGLYNGLSLGPTAVPALPAIHIGTADNSSKVYFRQAGTNYTRLRYEGFASATLTGTPIIYEVRFFNQVVGTDDIYVEIVIGAHGRTGGQWGITNGAASSATFTSFGGLTAGTGLVGTSGALAQNQSYVLVLSSTGTFKNLYAGYYISTVVT
jgi:hypothetical protein